MPRFWGVKHGQKSASLWTKVKFTHSLYISSQKVWRDFGTKFGFVWMRAGEFGHKGNTLMHKNNVILPIFHFHVYFILTFLFLCFPVFCFNRNVRKCEKRAQRHSKVLKNRLFSSSKKTHFDIFFFLSIQQQNSDSFEYLRKRIVWEVWRKVFGRN